MEVVGVVRGSTSQERAVWTVMVVVRPAQEREKQPVYPVISQAEDIYLELHVHHAILLARPVQEVALMSVSAVILLRIGTYQRRGVSSHARRETSMWIVRTTARNAQRTVKSVKISLASVQAAKARSSW